MSGIDEPMYGGGTQFASNINRLDGADLFGLDVQTAGSDESRYANSQGTARSDLHTTSPSVSTTEKSRTKKTMSVCRGVCQSIMLLISHL